MKLYSKENTRIEDGYYSINGYGFKRKYTCSYCSDTFEAKTPLAKYCSQRCKNDSNIEARKLRSQSQKNKECVVCSKELTESKNGRNKKYCSSSCKQKSYRMK